MTDTKERIWVRVGDADDYHEFPDLDHAIETLVVKGVICNGQPGPLTRHTGGFNCSGRLGGCFAVHPKPKLTGNNYVSCYWGDEDAQMIRELDDIEFAYVVLANCGHIVHDGPCGKLT